MLVQSPSSHDGLILSALVLVRDAIKQLVALINQSQTI